VLTELHVRVAQRFVNRSPQHFFAEIHHLVHVCVGPVNSSIVNQMMDFCEEMLAGYGLQSAGHTHVKFGEPK